MSPVTVLADIGPTGGGLLPMARRAPGPPQVTKMLGGEDPRKWGYGHESPELAHQPVQAAERIGGMATSTGNEQSPCSNDGLGTISDLATRLENRA